MTATVRGVKIGSGYPVVIQSMTDTSTMDTAGSAAQCEALSDAGAQIVRLT
ncbi:MAG: flavodoxin-dependent (E)-4-hydroxy-3-methylbut-2-enyl-diphosphate synthase, partial [Paramuribaculum sp.]|nr:flavodoxin-dependent (E)-4-hydroxy-3-methylbut-2-enyl-diphosphate synthase [Paramuribaculum sp.]